MPVIMGTAGHIDHGKTTLIKALTGIDCDRLSEEKKRGITIELGFAFMDLDKDLRLGIIDVPGHERFVKNMVSGAAGIDFVLLVIAADEGVMPQTREHLEICTLLGIETGIVALTKVDMVDGEWLELVQEDVSEFLKDTFLKDAKVIPVSAHTGAGLEQLTVAIKDLANSFRPRRRSDLFRLPIDRVFTMRGHGTVITGTTISGKLKVGDEIMVYPEGLQSRVKSIQVHGEQRQESLAGMRTAVNLHSLEVDELERGFVLAHAHTLFPGKVWDLELIYLPSATRPLKHRTEVHFHHGAREVMARIYLLDRDKVEPGEKCICQVRFERPMCGVYGDRCVLRSFSPLRTIAGAGIINPLAGKVKRRSDEIKVLEKLATSEGQELLAIQLDRAGIEGLSFACLRILTDMESRELEKVLQVMGGRQEVFLVDKEKRIYVGGRVVKELEKDLLNFMQEFHLANPLRQGISRGELASRWGKNLSDRLFHFLVERLIRQKKVVSELEVLRLPGHKVSLARDQEKLKQKIIDIYKNAGLKPPTVKKLLEELKLTLKEASEVLTLLQKENILVKVNEDFYFTRSSIDELKSKIIAYFEKNEEMGPIDFKDLTGLSRKFAIPLLEFMDKEKLTIRVGDRRRLRKAGRDAL